MWELAVISLVIKTFLIDFNSEKNLDKGAHI